MKTKIKSRFSFNKLLLLMIPIICLTGSVAKYIKEKSDFNNYGARKLNRNIRKELDRKLIDKIFI